MSTPALRRPKSKEELRDKITKNTGPEQFIILTLKNSVKLVVSSDSFNCIITVGDEYKCVLCNANMKLEEGNKEKHKTLPEHQRLLKVYPHLEELSENLVRQIDSTNCYCTICNVVTSTHSLNRHIKTEAHVQELEKAILRANTYKPHFDLNIK